MMNRMTPLFDTTGPPKPRRVLMHVIDAGPFLDDEDIVKFRCKCGYESERMIMKASIAKRGVPCPKCNKEASCKST